SGFTDNEQVVGVSPCHGSMACFRIGHAAGFLLLAFALPIGVQQVGGGERRVRWVSVAAMIAAVLLALQIGLLGLERLWPARSEPM
ncbi:MAG TPA: hypothetical protein VF148_15020, partial [Acidimicrobiia bacterium]